MNKKAVYPLVARNLHRTHWIVLDGMLSVYKEKKESTIAAMDDRT